MSDKIEFHFSSPEDSPGYLLGQVTMLWQRRQKKVLDPLDLTQTQFALLAALGWLSRTNPAVTQMDIANQTNADRMMVSKVLRTLEEKAFLTRQEHPSDTRAKVIQLTKSGTAVLRKALMAIEKADVHFFSAAGENLRLFNSTLAGLIECNKEE